MQVKLIRTSGYAFANKYLGLELPARRGGIDCCPTVLVVFPVAEPVGSSISKKEWHFLYNAVEIIEE